MRCTSYCTASSYRIKPLYDFLKERFPAKIYRDVLHIEVRRQGQDIQDVFYFAYGVVISWGLSEEDDLIFLKEVKDFEEVPFENIDKDSFLFFFGDSAKISKDEIILPNQDLFSRIAISHGLAQSVKLGTFESAIQKTINNTRQLPEDLAKFGKISLSKKEIRRKMGELFITRNSINLHFDVLDIPEFFWEYPEFEPLYTMTANYLDIETRVDVLNQRLAIVHELFEMLGNELNHQHSSKLEWIVILLIMIEVILTLMRDVFDWI